MHVGLNLVYLVPGETGGTETYARALIPALVALAPEVRFTAFVNRQTAGTPGPWGDLIGAVTVDVDARRRIEWVRGEQQLLPRLAQRAGVTVLHSLANTAPALGRFRRVTTIHDLIHRTVPDAHPGLRALGMRVLVPLAARRSDRIIVDAAATAGDLETHLGLAADRIDVVPLGLGAPPALDPTGEAAVRRTLGAGERPIALTVSAKLAHKNLRRLIGALARIEPDRRPLLVLPGYPTPHERELEAHAAALGVSGDVRFLGWVDAALLEGLYAAAAVFVFPSLAEGFGLPVLEAMVRGTPVACSAGGALGEVAGDAALRFDPESEPAIAEAMTRVISDPELSARLVRAGRERAAGFSWSRTARGTLRSYAAAVS